MTLHPNPVAKNRAARKRARRIDGDHAHTLLLGAIESRHAIHQSALPRSRRAGDSNQIGIPCSRKKLTEEFLRFGSAIFDRRDRARNRAHVSRAHLFRPFLHFFGNAGRDRHGGVFLCLSEELARDYETLNFACAFADRAQFYVAVIFFRRIVLHEAVASENLHCFIRYANGDFTSEELRHARLTRVAHALAAIPPRTIGEVCRLPHEQPSRFDFRRHVGELELDCLKFADGLAELFALLRVFHRSFVRALRHAQSQRGNRDSAAVKYLQTVDEALAFLSQQVSRRHTAIAENHFRSVARTHAHLVFFFPGAISGGALLNDEGGNSVMLL